MKHRLAAAALAAVVVGVAACSTEKPQGAITGPARPQRSATVPPTRTRTIDDEFDDIAAVVPGFGGVFIGRDGVAYVYHTKPGQAGLLANLQSRLPAGLRDRQIQVLQGQYDFHQLRSWKDGAVNVLNEPGTAFIDADEARNRVVIGVSDPGATERIVARAVELGVPKDALFIKIVQLATPHSSLNDDNVGNLASGLMVSVVDSASFTTLGQCTIGIVGTGESDSYYAAYHYGQPGPPISADLWQDKYYVITNSHCSGADTARMGHVFPGTLMAQFSSTYGWVADKYYDPPFLPGTGWGCPVGRKCRGSDAAAYKLRSSYCPYTYTCTHYPGFGTAYRTTTPWGDSTQYLGNNTIDGINGPWSIVSADNLLPIPKALYVGDSILKIGRNSGTTRGFVVTTCATSNQVGSTITIFCDDIADLYDAGGDSGAGVFVRSGSNTLYLAGLSWGGGTYGNGVYFDSFAPWGFVSSDLERIGHLFGPWY